MKQKILVVEDQRGPLQTLELAIRKVIFKEKIDISDREYSQEVLKERGVDVARCYNDAQDFIGESSYDLIFLDHRLPYENKVKLEKSDFSAFSASLNNIGYHLIQAIQKENPETVIIGTSSLSSSRGYGIPQPDYYLDKSDYDISNGLQSIIKKINMEKRNGK